MRSSWRNCLPGFGQAAYNDREDSPREHGEAARAFQRKLSARGWLTLAWPKHHGGLGAGPMQQLVYNEEMSRLRAPGFGGMGVAMVGPTLMMHGTDEQRERFLGRIARAEMSWCQGFSEPGAGSDLASLQTRAVLDGDEFVVNGQKIWTSGAQRADYCILLARTDPEAPKHRGISYFLMDMKSPGITITPLTNMLELGGTSTRCSGQRPYPAREPRRRAEPRLVRGDDDARLRALGYPAHRLRRDAAR